MKEPTPMALALILRTMSNDPKMAHFDVADGQLHLSPFTDTNREAATAEPDHYHPISFPKKDGELMR